MNEIKTDKRTRRKSKIRTTNFDYFSNQTLQRTSDYKPVMINTLYRNNNDLNELEKSIKMKNYLLKG